MATIPNSPPFILHLITVNNISSTKPTTLFTSSPRPSCHIKLFKSFSSLTPSNAEPSQPISPNSPQASSEPDPIKAAFERAQAYKKFLKPNPTSSIKGSNQVQKIERIGNEIGITGSVGTDPVNEKPLEVNSSANISQNLFEEVDGLDNDEGGSGWGNVCTGKKEVPFAVKMALERANKYKKDGGLVINSAKEALPGLKEGNKGNLRSASVEKKVSKMDNPKISSMDFVGLGFADKKIERGLPAGLVPFEDSFTEQELAGVEFIAGDSSMFGEATPSSTNTTEEVDIYKPKVSTWGVFPRPSNISKTFGGGRTLRPGDVLETEEDKAVKVKKTRQLLAAYKKKTGLNIDPKLKAECEKTLKDGDSLMDQGKLKEALPYYQEVMDKLPFKSEIHGVAALHWSICQDSLSRTNEAQIMYEKLQSHPNVPLSKKARQFMFGFQAMEMMRVTSSSTSSKNINYKDYFEAFIADKTKYFAQDGEAEEAFRANDKQQQQQKKQWKRRMMRERCRDSSCSGVQQSWRVEHISYASRIHTFLRGLDTQAVMMHFTCVGEVIGR